MSANPLSRRLLTLTPLLGALACTPGEPSGSTTEGGTSGETTTESSTDTDAEPPAVNEYDDHDLWLCHPALGEGDDHCRGASDLTATDVRADGGHAALPHELAADPGYDCFYVYPTVDLRLTPGNTEDFSDIGPVLDPLLSQAARFSGQCRVFAPLYHQATIGSYSADDPDTYLEIAYDDIAEAFRHYREHHAKDRRFVIMGHSQGAHMTRRLIQRELEPDPELHARMIVALLVGGDVTVPQGALVGGSFESTPLCTAAGQTGCVVAYRSYAAALPPENGNQLGIVDDDSATLDVACTNPGALADATGSATLSAAYFPTSSNQVLFGGLDHDPDVTTAFARYPSYYSAACARDDEGLSFLAIDVADAGDPRPNPVNFEATFYDPGFLGLHVLDYNFALGDLMTLVAAAAAG